MRIERQLEIMRERSMREAIKKIRRSSMLLIETLNILIFVENKTISGYTEEEKRVLEAVSASQEYIKKAIIELEPVR